MGNIYFSKEALMVEAENGRNLLDVMRKAGLHPDAPCGGNGQCGKCRIRVLEQNGEKKDEPEVILACQTLAEGDMVIDTMLEESASIEILKEGHGQELVLDPVVKQIRINMRACPTGESISDWTRFMEGLQQSLGEEGKGKNFRPVPELCSAAGTAQKEGKGKVYAVLCEEQVLDISAEEKNVFLAAFDIGTTTVVGYLLNAKSGAQEAVVSRMNPQAQYGADVINRSNYAIEYGLSEVTGCIRKAVNDMLGEMALKAGIGREDIYAVSIAGNTCMHHLFLGISVDSLVHAPYNPAVEESMILQCGGYGLQVHPGALLYMLPNIAGFVGADTVACLVASDLAEQEEWTLLIDIGTNGEMVLGRNHRMAACSTAAGPAFEGAKITHGMRGGEGAISKVKIENGEIHYETIGGTKPRGICGSGLLDLVAQLLKNGMMDEAGVLEEKPVLLADKDSSATGAPITLEQKDISELQLAKAAIASGVRLLA
ncbi:MAG: DUF4445 domain-containing protein, partial [Blautia sp.]|nr:DUF4445 domain-containing protein [Blautia sp.]